MDLWIVEVWTGAAWARVCADSTRKGGEASLNEMAATGDGPYRLLTPGGRVYDRRPARRSQPVAAD